MLNRQQPHNAHWGPSRPGPTVMLADREPFLGERRAMLERAGFAVVASASSAEEAVDAAVAAAPQLCVVASDLPGSSLDAVREIHHAVATEIAVLTNEQDRRSALTWIRAGANGCLPTSISPNRMAAALRGLADGRPAVPETLAPLMPETVAEPAPPASNPVQRTVLYVPRFTHHLRRRLRSDMSLGQAWRSARVRMRDYH
jgi:DNA-binding NarL/FixJ family response regulator